MIKISLERKRPRGRAALAAALHVACACTPLRRDSGRVPPVTRSLLLLAPCTALLLWLAPLAARADADPNDPNSPIGAKIPCFDAAAVPGALSLDVPDDASAVFFSDLKDCATLCKRAGLSCMNFVRRAATCELRFADDRRRFKQIVNCAGLKGADSKACNADTEPAHDLQRETAEDKRALALSACDARAADCKEKCSAP
jgi:hypothetical protein